MKTLARAIAWALYVTRGPREWLRDALGPMPSLSEMREACGPEGYTEAQRQGYRDRRVYLARLESAKRKREQEAKRPPSLREQAREQTLQALDTKMDAAIQEEIERQRQTARQRQAERERREQEARERASKPVREHHVHRAIRERLRSGETAFNVPGDWRHHPEKAGFILDAEGTFVSYEDIRQAAMDYDTLTEARDRERAAVDEEWTWRN